MAGNIYWESGAVQSLGIQASGTGLQLTNGSAVVLSGAALGVLDNTGASGGPAFFGLAQLVTATTSFGAAVSANTSVDFYLVPSRNGTVYADADVAGPVLPANHFKGSFLVTVSGSSRMNLMIEAIPLLPIKYLGYIQNNTGQTLNSGWGILIDTYAEAYT